MKGKQGTIIHDSNNQRTVRNWTVLKVLMAVIMKRSVSWEEALYSLTEANPRFERTYCLHLKVEEWSLCLLVVCFVCSYTLKMESIHTSEMSVNSYQITLRNIPEYSTLYSRNHVHPNDTCRSEMKCCWCVWIFSTHRSVNGAFPNKTSPQDRLFSHILRPRK